MKILVAVLVIIFLALQYRLWFGDGSIQEVSRLRAQALELREEVVQLRGQNKALAAEVADLKSGLEAIEERARSDLGMIGEGETFYQFVRDRGARQNLSVEPLETENSAGQPATADPVQ